MKMKANVMVTAAKRFNVDGTKMAQLYVLGDKVEEEDRIGAPVMKLNGDYDLFEQLKGAVPGHVEIEFEIRAGGGDKMTQYVTAVKPVQHSSAPQQSAATQAAPKPGNKAYKRPCIHISLFTPPFLQAPSRSRPGIWPMSRESTIS